jgi:hypothetical protein
MSTRCPKCAKLNYGETAKCSFCGASLKFTPGEEIPEVKDEDLKEKIKTVKAKRIRNPMQIGVGGVVMVVGLMAALIIFLACMFLVFSPSSITPNYRSGAWHYDVPGGSEIVYGEITAKVSVKDSKWDAGSNHGYGNHTAYELSGNGQDDRVEALRDGSIGMESDCWVYSKQDLGSVGDSVLVKVESKSNPFKEARAVVVDKQGKGILSGWPYILPGLLILLVGGVILTIGIVGKADTSLERLLQEDKEFRKQQLAMMQAARKAAIEKQKQSTWTPEHLMPGSQPMPMDPAVVGPAPEVTVVMPETPPPAMDQPQQPSAVSQVPEVSYIPPEQVVPEAVNTSNNP